jgi:hypothetical protein
MLPPRSARPTASTWRSDLKRVLTPLFLLLAALSLAACSQNRGDPCQVTSDCGSGLLCCPAADTPRGVCLQATACPGEVIDASTSEPDASGNTDGEDAGGGEDAGVSQ